MEKFRTLFKKNTFHFNRILAERITVSWTLRQNEWHGHNRILYVLLPFQMQAGIFTNYFISFFFALTYMSTSRWRKPDTYGEN